MSDLLEVRKLVKTFRGRHGGADVPALQGADLEIRRGEHLAVVGTSGCGKTTLARIIMGLETPDGGTMFFDGRRVGLRDRRSPAFIRRVSMVFQDPFSSLDPRFTVRDILREALTLEKAVGSDQVAKKMRRVLTDVGLTEQILGRYPHAFSGGERQRIAIARALMTDPALLILDEAVSALDVLVQRKVLDLLLDLGRRTSVTMLFITHNMRVVEKISQKVAVMSEGVVVEYGLTQQVLRVPAHPYTQALLAAAFDYQISGGQDQC